MGSKEREVRVNPDGVHVEVPTGEGAQKFDIGDLADCLQLEGLRQLGIEAYRRLADNNVGMKARGMAATGLAMLADIIVALQAEGIVLAALVLAAGLNALYFLRFAGPHHAYALYNPDRWEEDYRLDACDAMAQWAGDVNYAAILTRDLNAKNRRALRRGVLIAGAGIAVALAALIL